MEDGAFIPKNDGREMEMVCRAKGSGKGMGKKGGGDEEGVFRFHGHWMHGS